MVYVLAELALVAGSADADVLFGVVVDELAGVDGESADEAGVSDLAESLVAGLSLAGVDGESDLGTSVLESCNVLTCDVKSVTSANNLSTLVFRSLTVVEFCKASNAVALS